ncbi:MAG: hypothetical protein IJ242_15220 [Clostridia bacterium]|nr:hypothetical protein [Clostridia bacterium]
MDEKKSEHTGIDPKDVHPTVFQRILALAGVISIIALFIMLLYLLRKMV